MVKVFSKKIFYFSVIILSFFPLITFSLSSVLSNLTYSNSSKEIKLSNIDLDIDLDIDLPILPEIDFDNLNDLWYNSKIEMLIITPNRTDFIDAVKPLRDWKNQKGVKTIILSNFSLYEGVDDAEKIRNMIKSYNEHENLQWVLLAGDAQDDLIPIRNVYNPDTVRWTDNPNQELGNQNYKPTDFYYADLTSSWDDDIDGIYGEAPQDNSDGFDEISWTPEVYVGRLPASNADELEIMINKTLQYEMNPKIGDWMNRMLLAGGVSDYPEPDDPDGEDEAYLTEYIWNNYVISEMNFTHLHRTTTFFTPEVPPSPNDEGLLTSFKTKFNQGYSTVLFAGHGAYNQFADDGGQIYRSSDANSASNAYMPSLIYADACTTSPYDINSRDSNIGEILIKKDQSGAIGFIGGLRVTWYFADDPNLEMINRANAKLFWKAFFEEKKFQQGKALYDSKVSYINSDYFTRGTTSLENDFERKNILTYCLLGDPELDVYTNKPKLVINPFTEPIYEGQLVSTTIKDVDERIVPYARVHLETLDGKYHTAYADIQGNVKFRVPNQENEVYNIIITGHNLIPSYFNFTVFPDDIKPQLVGIEHNPKNLVNFKKINFDIEIQDNSSGIESVYFFVTKNNFINYSYYVLSNSYEENRELFTFTINTLMPDEYSYFILSRDYANNTNSFYNSEFKFTVHKPIIEDYFIFFVILVIGIVGISVFIGFKGIKKYSEIIRKIEEKL